VLALVVEVDVAAVVPHVDTVAAALDPPSEVPGPDLRNGTLALGTVAVEHPDRLLPHVDLLAGCVDELADEAWIHRPVRGLMTATATDPERLRPHVDRLARPLRCQTGPHRRQIIDALLAEQWSAPGQKRLVLDVLRTALPESAGADPELWRDTAGAIVRIADGTESPRTTGATADLLGRVGSKVQSFEEAGPLSRRRWFLLPDE